ncbi:hypothetical protein DFH07DRAFT_793903 [Mycena maculata]|uniref:F-box domain-containing protein n=1 Tax=Mycena maculata TaxID=230809 RepID=A0AAD7KCC7_9AGAR|nr:hypothetical protein DFH07DRAFT_793903 [Mycena maculata]
MPSRCSECGAFPAISREEDGSFDLNVTARTLARHQQLLTTNEPPESPELIYVRSVLSKTDARLEWLDDEISRLQDRLKQLEEERGALSAYRAQNHLILSPLRRIPAEILTEIFAWTLPSVVKPSAQSDIKASPWTLSHTSRRWRAISISIPCLWSQVSINYAHDSVYSLDLVKTHVQRARTLKIHFCGNRRSDSRPQVKIFTFLSEHSSRWQELDVELTPNLLPLMVTLRGRLPTLRRVAIQWNGIQTPPLSCFQTAPLLVDADIRSRYLPILLPVRQLTRYRVEGSWAMHRDILKTTPNLVEARITVSGDDPWPNSDQKIDLPHLQCVDVSVLDHLRVPALAELGVHVTRAKGLRVYKHLSPLISRSHCTLRTLCLRGSPDATAVAEFLRKFTTITRFVLIIGTNSDEDAAHEVADVFLVQLTVANATGDALSPQLSEIIFAFEEHTSYIEYPLYLKMLRSRWKANGCALKAAALLARSAPGPDSVTLNGLDIIRQQGLNVVLLDGEQALDVMTQRWRHTIPLA